MKPTTVVDGMRPCSVCGAVLPVEAFTSHKTYCPPCRQAYSRKYYERNAGKWRIYHQKKDGTEETTAARRERKPVEPEKAVAKQAAPEKAAKGQARGRAGTGAGATTGGCPYDVDRLDAVERRPGRVPKLFGERHGGVHLCFVSDGVEETGLFVWAGEAVGAWNDGVTCQVSGVTEEGRHGGLPVQALEMDRPRLEGRGRPGVLDLVDKCVDEAEMECSSSVDRVKEC